jgi:hypothetical protein
MKKLMNFISLKVLEWVYLDSYKAINVGSFKTYEYDFYSQIEGVLDFIKDIDTRRHLRITNELIWIVNTNLVRKGGGRYYQNLGACMVNIKSYTQDVNEIVSIANLIIHASTRAYIQSKGFKYVDENRAQIERICLTERNRFTDRARLRFPEVSDDNYKNFDPAEWLLTWNKPKWRGILDDIKRIARS